MEVIGNLITEKRLLSHVLACNLYVQTEGNQNTSPPKMPLWHIAGFELEALKKQQGQGHSAPPTAPQKQEIKLPRGRGPPAAGMKPFLPREPGTGG